MTKEMTEIVIVKRSRSTKISMKMYHGRDTLTDLKIPKKTEEKYTQQIFKFPSFLVTHSSKSGYMEPRYEFLNIFEMYEKCRYSTSPQNEKS